MMMIHEIRYLRNMLLLLIFSGLGYLSWKMSSVWLRTKGDKQLLQWKNVFTDLGMIVNGEF